jgi:hypothetical protein
MSLPIFLSASREMSQMQSSWAALLNPVLSNPLFNGVHLPNVELSTGANTINHKLGRRLQGWIITRKRAGADIYDTQQSNARPNLTLDLVSSANVTVDLYVY